jgi:hypothetical protein
LRKQEKLRQLLLMLLKQAAAGSNRWRQPPADAGKYERYCYTRKEKSWLVPQMQ